MFFNLALTFYLQAIKYIINSAISLVADLYLTLHSNEITFSFTIYAEKISTSVAWNYYLIHLEENRRKKKQYPIPSAL